MNQDSARGAGLALFWHGGEVSLERSNVILGQIFHCQAERNQSAERRTARRVKPSGPAAPVRLESHGPVVFMEQSDRRPKPSLDPETGRLVDTWV